MTRALLLCLILPWLLLPALAPRPAAAQPAGAATESVEQALCRLIEGAAQAQSLPVAFLTRLIWRESSFRPGVVSPAGAQGVAQFMPGTAAERGLADPFDPEQAIPHAARLLSDLRRRFGNLGLAAAAYNGGPGRVSSWLAGSGGLPGETRSYVSAITGRTAEDWAAEAKADAKGDLTEPPGTRCLQVTAALRIRGRTETYFADSTPSLAPWGIQLAGNFSKAAALAAFGRARALYASVLGEVRPMVIGTRFRSRGTRAFYRIRVPAETRQAAEGLCNRIRGIGGACLVLKT
ncbi:Lytic transglycosylase catalytic [Methylobacterium sp. 4-46]|uniref:lytic transglycosylase domain-containing protein n=1 Tax=unclassified Methylobacterium TaxID=2615210 RepID=UPI000165CDBB|nr:MULTISPECIES: lytic transglycosylase domain-containing protein [Methylobacterium]ACA18860.1 Lytic transglycosylase catalytic [Methylobacterium sp. 4-46]WFT78085.1 lytic transglycosylase domain-containing protein [Methylobacterium nodulans]